MFIKLNIVGLKEEVRINTSNISSIFNTIVKMNNQDILELESDSLRNLLMIVDPKDKTVKEEKLDDELVELFNKLHVLTKGKGKPIFNQKRQKQLKFLLSPTKGNMTAEQLIKAATNIGKDEFLQGANDGNSGKGKRYGDVDYLLRPDKAAKYAEIETQGKKMF